MSDLQPTRAERAAKLMDDHRSTSNRRRLVTTAVVVIAVAGSVFGVQRLLAPEAEEETTATAPKNATEDFGFRLTPAMVNDDDDQPDPAVTVAVYEDFQCPSCAVFEEESGDFLRTAVESGRIVLEYRPFAFLGAASTNEYSPRAANAAACVADATSAVELSAFHAMAFAEQPEEGGPGPDDDTLIAWAEKAGAPDVGPCIRDERFAAWIAEALVEGKDRGVTETPTVTVNDSILSVAGDDGGTRVPRADDLDRAITGVEQ